MKSGAPSFCAWSQGCETGACLPNWLYVTKETLKQGALSLFSEILSHSGACQFNPLFLFLLSLCKRFSFS